MAEGTAHSSTRLFPAGAAERQGLRAGVVSRTGAMVIDAGYAAVLVAVAYLVFAGIRFLRDARSFRWPSPSWEDVVLVGAILVTFALAIGWSGVGRSVGMRFMGLRLVGPDGDPIGFVRAFARAALCVIFPLGLFWCAASRRNASVHDLIFRTQVLYDWQAHIPSADRGTSGAS